MTREEYLPIIERVLDHFEVKPRNLKVRVKKVSGGGRCRHNGNNDFSITLPHWLWEYDRYYAIYYTIHEACHLVRVMLHSYARSHNETFKKIEDEALALWKIKIVRAKAYPKELYVNGKKIYNIVQ